MKNLTERLRIVEESHADKILAAIGAKPQTGKKHQRCPFPDHEDKNPSFRYDADANRIFCTCLPETGVSLTDALMKVRGLADFNAAVREIEAITGERVLEGRRKQKQSEPGEQAASENREETDEQAEQREAEERARSDAASDEKAAKIAWVQKQVAKTRPLAGSPGEEYLRNIRGLVGIDLEHDALRYAPDFQCKPGGKKSPALVAVVTDNDGNIVGMQGTILNPNGQPIRDENGKKTKLSAGYIGDGSVRIKNKLGTGTIAIAEGIETGLTRLFAGPAEIRVCLGSIRPETIGANAGRIEIIADSDKAQDCRQIARELAAENPDARVHVVTVPSNLGEKADLNDLLQDMGRRAVAAAVDDADRIHARQRRSNVEQLVRGSDEEIADRVLENLEDLFGRIVITEGTVWIYDGKLWTALNDNRLTRAIARFDGATYPTPSNGIGEVKITSSKAQSVKSLLMSKRDDDGFFEGAPVGITCESGFVLFEQDVATGEYVPRLEPHARKHRARHAVRGVWPVQDAEKRLLGSDVMKLLTGLFSAKTTLRRLQHEAPNLEFDLDMAEQDKSARIELILQTAAAAALGIGTQMKHPQALIWIRPGGAGKSTTRKVISSLISADALQSVPPAKMGQDYFVSVLRGCALNVAEETSDRDLSGDALKKVITGDICHARLPYGIPFYFTPTAQHVFICNELPAFSGGIDSGVERRFKVLVFDKAYSEEQADEGLADRIIEHEADLLLHLVVVAAGELLTTRRMADPMTSRIAKEAWMRDADRVRAWAAERLSIKANNVVTVADLYSNFRLWCAEEGVSDSRIPARNSFARRLRHVEPRLVPGPNSKGARFENAILKTA